MLPGSEWKHIQELTLHLRRQGHWLPVEVRKWSNHSNQGTCVLFFACNEWAGQCLQLQCFSWIFERKNDGSFQGIWRACHNFLLVCWLHLSCTYLQSPTASMWATLSLANNFSFIKTPLYRYRTEQRYWFPKEVCLYLHVKKTNQVGLLIDLATLGANFRSWP